MLEGVAQVLCGEARTALVEDQHNGQKDEQHRHANGRDHHVGGHPDGFGGGQKCLFVVGHALAAQQQAVGVDAVGRASLQGAIVLAAVELHFRGVFRKDDADLDDLVGERLAQDGDREQVALAETVQVGEKPRRGQAPVAGNRRVGVRPAYRQAGALDVAAGNLQHGLVGAMVDGQAHVNAGDVYVAHDARARHVQQAAVLLRLLGRGNPAVSLLPQALVVPARLLQQPVHLLLRHPLHRLDIRGDGPGLVQRIPPVAECGVHQ